MENNKSKLNTYLLIILIILVLVIIIFNIFGGKFVKPNTETGYYQQEQQGQIDKNIVDEKSQAGDSMNFKEYTLGNSYFKYESDSNIKTGELTNGLYADISNGDKLIQIKYYADSSNTKPFKADVSNSNSTIINNKTFYYSDVLVEGDLSYRTYWYQKDNKIIVISGQLKDFSLIDLNSIYIN